MSSLKAKLVSAVTSAAAARGYELTPQWRMDAQPLARHLRKVFALHGVDCVLDVGANKGQFRDFLREDVAFTGPIVSFEPVSRYVELLKGRAEKDPGWTIVSHALGNAHATTEINVTQSPGLNSFLEPRHDAVPGFWDGQAIVKEAVRIERLDDVYRSLKTRLAFQRPYLKLDTQGFDLEVIRGAAATIGEIVGLQTEASVRPIYGSMPTYQETIDTMVAHGFALSSMFSVTHDDRLRLVEFDCVMVR